jgi:hypothetical protein
MSTDYRLNTSGAKHKDTGAKLLKRSLLVIELRKQIVTSSKLKRGFGQASNSN